MQELCTTIRTADLRSIERRLSSGLERDRMSARPDGYRSGGEGGGHDLDDNGEAAAWYSDPTGGAVQARVDRPGRDELHEHLEHAYGYLEQTAASLGALARRLDAVDDLRGGAHDPPRCQSCARVGREADMVQFSDVGGRLNVLLRLCQWCYDQTRRRVAAGVRLALVEVLPVERVAAYHEGRKLRERAAS